MREILFRAKRIDNGKWVEGYFIKGRWYFDNRDIFAIIPTDVCFYPHCEIDDYIEVDPETVCQYTGLIDKNGNKIYEGDIVDILCEVDELGVIEWDVKTARFLVSADGFTADFDNYRGTDLEVIDNIFDNPELAGKGSEE